MSCFKNFNIIDKKIDLWDEFCHCLNKILQTVLSENIFFQTKSLFQHSWEWCMGYNYFTKQTVISYWNSNTSTWENKFKTEGEFHYNYIEFYVLKQQFRTQWDLIIPINRRCIFGSFGITIPCPPSKLLAWLWVWCAVQRGIMYTAI